MRLSLLELTLGLAGVAVALPGKLVSFDELNSCPNLTRRSRPTNVRDVYV